MLQATQLREYNKGVFSSNYCEISKNTYFEEHLRTAAFESKIEFSQSMKTVQSAANIHRLLFFKVLARIWLLLNVQQFLEAVAQRCSVKSV